MSLFSQLVENVFYIKGTEDPDEPWESSALANVADYLEDWVIGSIQPIGNANVTYRELYLTDLTTETSPTYSRVLGFPGDVSGAAMPGNVTITTTFKTSGRGRSSRGRNYWVGINQNLVTGNTVSSTLTTNIRLAYLQLNVQIADAPRVPNHVVVSRRANGAWRTEALVQKVTSYVVVDNFIDSQRRRLTGRGL